MERKMPTSRHGTEESPFFHRVNGTWQYIFCGKRKFMSEDSEKATSSKRNVSILHLDIKN